MQPLNLSYLLPGICLLCASCFFLGLSIGGGLLSRAVEKSSFFFWRLHHFLQDDSVGWIIYDKRRQTFHFLPIAPRFYDTFSIFYPKMPMVNATISASKSLGENGPNRNVTELK